jgi:hypothetical protein
VLTSPPVKEEVAIVHHVSKIKSNPAKTSKKLQVKIKSISPQALVIVSFNLRMRVPENITAIDSDVMSIRVMPGADSDAKYLRINSWTVTKFTELTMQIQLEFENPLRISSNIEVSWKLINALESRHSRSRISQSRVLH